MPANKKSDKSGKAKGKDESKEKADGSGSKLKAATSINARHILVCEEC